MEENSENLQRNSYFPSKLTTLNLKLQRLRKWKKKNRLSCTNRKCSRVYPGKELYNSEKMCSGMTSFSPTIPHCAAAASMPPPPTPPDYLEREKRRRFEGADFEGTEGLANDVVAALVTGEGFALQMADLSVEIEHLLRIRLHFDDIVKRIADCK
ncbi:hypothetical protein ACJIZ3_004131 [Penstemon smallii]|uniref:Uncharacterized protein n=1 Tax=Penstemon smallii TaxID=265156 RepID=A0ABD3S192_9LAMI